MNSKLVKIPGTATYVRPNEVKQVSGSRITLYDGNSFTTNASSKEVVPTLNGESSSPAFIARKLKLILTLLLSNAGCADDAIKDLIESLEGADD